MYCKHCGRELSDLAAVCVHCGAETAEPTQLPEDRGGAGWWFLGFFIPLAGLLIWIFCQDTQPKKSRSAGIGALFGLGASILLYVLFWVVWVLLMAFALS